MNLLINLIEDNDDDSDDELEYNIKAAVRADECIGCTSCVAVCPTEAITMNKDNIAVVDPKLCIGCGSCVGVCPTECIDLVDVKNDDKEEK